MWKPFSYLIALKKAWEDLDSEFLVLTIPPQCQVVTVISAGLSTSHQNRTLHALRS